MRCSSDSQRSARADRSAGGPRGADREGRAGQVADRLMVRDQLADRCAPEQECESEHGLAAGQPSRDRVRRNEQEIRCQQRRVVERREVRVHHRGERPDDDEEPQRRASAPHRRQRDCRHGQHVQGERAVAVATGQHADLERHQQHCGARRVKPAPAHAAIGRDRQALAAGRRGRPERGAARGHQAGCAREPRSRACRCAARRTARHRIT